MNLHKVSEILHSEIHNSFVHKVQKEVSHALEPGGEEYTKNIKALRIVVGNSDSRNVERNIRHLFQGFTVKRIDIKPIHEREQHGLITTDDCCIEVIVEFSDDVQVKFD